MIDNFSAQDLDRMPSIARGEVGVHRVPLVVATAEALRGYGRLEPAFDPSRVEIVPWPTAGWRPLVPGTGVEGGVATGRFEMRREGGLLRAHNHAVTRSYITGWYDDPATARADVAPRRRDRLYTHEANYHPDGGQLFCPRDGRPFVALLAPPGDDVAPADFVAFWFDGSTGLQIAPGVWHQPLFPCGDVGVFDDAQGRVHACVAVDFVTEHGVLLEVPLVR